jgi:DDE family transposase
MHAHYTPDPLLVPLQRHLTKPQWHNLLALVLAVQLARTLVQRQLALYLVWMITTESCYRRLERILAWDPAVWERLAPVWVRAVLSTFAPGRGALVLLIDWTLHRDRCRSLWVMLPVGGRAVPIAFWLAPPQMGGVGAQRALEDQALIQLRAWLPRSRRVVLIGDRGFRGRDRMRLLKQLRFHFILRVTGDTMIEIHREWVRLQQIAPGVGERRQWGQVLYGKEKPKERLRVNLVSVRQALPSPKRRRTNKGKPTGEIVEETTWFLATDLPLSIDVVALYQRRMQVEQSFRDSKSLLGMENEQTKRPWERLRGLLWAVTIGLSLDLQWGGGRQSEGSWLPRVGPEGRTTEAIEEQRYPSESATRRGLHALVVATVLGPSPLKEALEAMAAKSERMQGRPQVRERRRPTPALRRRTKLSGTCPVHA